MFRFAPLLPAGAHLVDELVFLDAVFGPLGVEGKLVLALLLAFQRHFVSLLVREGYSPHFGARPLKRVVERLLLLPVARAISSGSLRGRTILRLTAVQNRIEAAVTGAPETKPGAQAKGAPSLSASRRLAAMFAEYKALESVVQPLAERKSELVLRTSAPNFYDDAAARAATFDEIHKLEQFLGLHDGLGKVLSGISQQVERTGVAGKEEVPLAERVAHLSMELQHLQFVARSRDAKDLGDAIISLSLVDRSGAAQGAVLKLTEMYQGLAARHRMTSEVLGEHYNDKRDTVYLSVSGLGAYGLFVKECGLHQVDHRYKERTPRSGREVIRENRELIRVEVHPFGQEPPKGFMQNVRTKTATLKPAQKRLMKTELAVSLFHEPTVRSIDFWTSGPKQAAIGRGMMILSAQVQDNSRAASGEGVIRSYDVGLAPKVKDIRTGRATTRVDQVLKGSFGALLFRE